MPSCTITPSEMATSTADEPHAPQGADVDPLVERPLRDGHCQSRVLEGEDELRALDGRREDLGRGGWLRPRARLRRAVDRVGADAKARWRSGDAGGRELKMRLALG